MKEELSRLESEPLYREVYQASPQESELTRKSLEETREHLRNALNQKQADREVIETKLYHCKGNKEENAKRLHRVKNQAQHPVDETLAFPAYGNRKWKA